jgi:hypothetical protein
MPGERLDPGFEFSYPSSFRSISWPYNLEAKYAHRKVSAELNRKTGNRKIVLFAAAVNSTARLRKWQLRESRRRTLAANRAAGINIDTRRPCSNAIRPVREGARQPSNNLGCRVGRGSAGRNEVGGHRIAASGAHYMRQCTNRLQNVSAMFKIGHANMPVLPATGSTPMISMMPAAFFLLLDFGPIVTVRH